jgi:hypothetical protein
MPLVGSGHPIPTRGADYAHNITACPPGFENLTVSLRGNSILEEVLLCSKSHDFLAVFALAHSKINQIA